MINLLFSGQIALFLLIILALVLSLSFHEFGHAITAKFFGDDTAQRMGRLTLNPLAHIDPIGLLMVVMVGFGYAKPVPTNPRNFTSRYADLVVSAAGPFMNLLLAFITINAYLLLARMGVEAVMQPGPRLFVQYLTIINLVLMLFNLIPLGALDGHYILPHFLGRYWGNKYRQFNEQYGNMALLGLVLLSVAGLPVFSFILSVGSVLMPLIAIV